MLVLLTSRDVSTATLETRQPNISSAHLPDSLFRGQRQLRSVQTGERGIISSIKMWAKVKYWASAGKSEEYVKKSLGIDGLSGKSLEKNPNYKCICSDSGTETKATRSTHGWTRGSSQAMLGCTWAWMMSRRTR
ncbi:unnamed protein product [Phytophthora fragariaefolia]|uniref:Unnamed protein product n=1 Tax=Phytophthora fragariaefolia TaxID=1490495 RepID=A0A9W6X4Z6_9STRA|nr:unnamed protein product [Phytophthora fragariaefolia]